MTQREIFWENPVQGAPLDTTVFGFTSGTGAGLSQGVFGELNRTVTAVLRGLLYVLADGAAITDAECALEVIEFTNTGLGPGPCVRGSLAASASFEGYIAAMNGTAPYSFSLNMYRGGVLTNISGSVENTKGVTPATGVNIRMKVEGSAIKARFWKRGSPEPTTWDIEHVNTELVSGAVGVFSTNVGLYRFGKLSIGYNGQAAPPLEYRIAGSVRDLDDAPVARVVRAYERASGRMQGETTSSATDGAFDLMVKKLLELHYVIALDVRTGTHNAVIKDRIVPYAG